MEQKFYNDKEVLSIVKGHLTKLTRELIFDMIGEEITRKINNIKEDKLKIKFDNLIYLIVEKHVKKMLPPTYWNHFNSSQSQLANRIDNLINQRINDYFDKHHNQIQSAITKTVDNKIKQLLKLKLED